MKKLTLIRHAKSDWSDPDLSDFERTLNTRGKKAAPMMGQRMRQRDSVPDLIISSPANRADKTARLLAKELELPQDTIVHRREIYAASLATLSQLICEFPDHEHIAVVGHNPGLTDLGLWLCDAAPDWLPTCAVLELELLIDDWPEAVENCGRVRYFDYPKKPCAENN